MKKSIVIIILLALFAGCESGESIKNSILDTLGYKKEEAKFISHTTSGLIAADDKIVVRFQDFQVRDEHLNISLKKKIFDFEPSITGQAYWSDRQTLVFAPNNLLKLHTRYSGILDIAKLLPGIDDLPISNFKLNFAVAGREIISYKADFKPVSNGKPNQVVLKGYIRFNQFTRLEELTESISLASKDRTIPLIIEKGSQSNQFIIKSKPLVRGTVTEVFDLSVDKSRLDLARDNIRQLVLPTLSALKVSGISGESSGKSLNLQITFSDNLDPDWDYNGFIVTTPKVDLKLSISNNRIIAHGDFSYGTEYSVLVNQGVKSKWGTKLSESHIGKVVFSDIEPQMEFLHSGVFLPSSNDRKISLRTVNLSHIRLQISKVYSNNLCQFLQDSSIKSSKRSDYYFYSLRRVGVDIYNKEIELDGDIKNKWIQTELDLNSFLEKHTDGLFIIQISYDRDDLMYKNISSSKRHSYYDENTDRYINTSGRISKPLILSDIGLSAKKTRDGVYIYTTDVKDALPLSDVDIKLYSYQNQILGQGITDSNGECVIENVKGFFIEATKNGQRSILKFNECALPYSLFDTGGQAVTDSGLKAFIYTERGVYRPGDEINLSVILRNEKDTYPEAHPVKLLLFNPKNQKVKEIVNKEGIDGFYSFTIKTEMEDITGNWRAKIDAGGKTFSHVIKIETIVPYKLKVRALTEKDQIDILDGQFDFSVQANYLFGTPAANHRAKIEVEILPVNMKFNKFRDFVFTNSTSDFKAINNIVFDSNLNDEGKIDISYKLPQLKNIPSAVKLGIKSIVYEKSGRQVRNMKKIDLKAYNYFVGIQKPGRRPIKIGEKQSLNTIVVTEDGQPVSGRLLKYKIYKNQYRWWWHFDSVDEYRKHYKYDYSTVLLEEGEFISDGKLKAIEFVPDSYGEILVEVSDGDNGHVASVFIRAYRWGEGGSGHDANTLEIKTDKQSYFPGETARLIFNSPENGTALISVEKRNEILKSDWMMLDGYETVVDLKITEEMFPNVYFFASVFQPHSQTANDRPARMYGVVPIKVERKDGEIPLNISVSSKLEPRKDFEVELQAADGIQTQFTIAVVDEGLLDITGFKTPDAKEFFFRKEMLSVESYDIYSQFIGANWGEVYKRFSIGGGFDTAGQDALLDSRKAKRFKPVSMFTGPITTNEKGYAKVKFTMPDYIGSVRIMAIAASGSRYGKAEKTLPVTSPLMAMPSLPRAIGPKDRFFLPVTVFTMEEGIGEIEISAKSGNLINIIGQSSKTVVIKGKGEKEIFFEMQASTAVGVEEIKIKAKSDKYSFEKTISLPVRAYNTYISSSTENVIKPGETVDIFIPGYGIDGSNSAQLQVARLKDLNLTHRLNWLIRYPYGCLEQTVSSVFPQLYLKDMEGVAPDKANIIDYNINAGINRLHRFRLQSGGFAYWPGNRDADGWATNYAGHFLLEAKAQGYYVPQDIILQWQNYQERMSITAKGTFLERAYRLYLLALSGRPGMGQMNLMKENSLMEMPNTAKLFLAAAYKLSGAESIARNIVSMSGTDVDEYKEFGGTYGSTMRDKAIILELLLSFDKMDEVGLLYRDIAEKLSRGGWYSTQTTAFMLRSVHKFIEKSGGNDYPIKCLIKLPYGNPVQVTTNELTSRLDIDKGFGKNLTITNNSSGNVYTVLNWEGIPLRDGIKTEQKNINLFVEWLDEDGINIDPTEMKQGDTFWGHFKVNTAYNETIHEVALNQMLPAGWEIENIRLSGENMPAWARKYALGREEYVDIRDDRVMWFFDIYSYSTYDFLVKLNAVSMGEFYLPPTFCEAMYDNDFRATVAGREVKVFKK